MSAAEMVSTSLAEAWCWLPLRTVAAARPVPYPPQSEWLEPKNEEKENEERRTKKEEKERRGGHLVFYSVHCGSSGECSQHVVTSVLLVIRRTRTVTNPGNTDHRPNQEGEKSEIGRNTRAKKRKTSKI
jgi:hypothetical protein